MELQSLKQTELYEVKFDHQGCEVEIYFFSVNNTNFNMILTGGYYNPYATNHMLLKLMNAANNHNSMDSIGFIGVFTADQTSTVKECIERAFQTLKNRVKTIEQQLKEIKKIDAMLPSKTIEDIVYQYFNDEFKAPQPKSPPESLSSRFLRPRKPNEQMVDLTDVDEETPNVNNIEVPDELFYDVCCSEASDNDPLFGHFAGEEKNKLKEEVKRWSLESDFAMYPDDHEKCPNLRGLQEKIEDILKEKKRNELKFMKEQAVSMSHVENPVDRPSTSEYNIKSLNDTEAMKYYKNKAAEDRDSIKVIKRNPISSQPQLGRGWDHSRNLTIDVTPRTSLKRILDAEDYQKLEEDKKNKKQKQRLTLPELSKFVNYTIPKKFRSPDIGFSPSVVSSSPSLYARRPIHDIIKNRSSNKLSAQSEKMISTFYEGPPKCETPPAGYLGIHRGAKRSSFEVESLADKVENIDLVGDDENKNSDVNNNGQRQRKALYNIETPKKNKIFTTKQQSKQDSKPDFHAKRNGGRQ